MNMTAAFVSETMS